MRIGIFIDGTFIPERDGASTRFAFLTKQLVAAGIDVVVFHCFRGWSRLEQISEQPFPTYFFRPNIFYSDLSLLKSLVEYHKLDIIQLNDIESMYSLGFPLAANRPLRTVFEAHYHTSTLARQLGLLPERVHSIERLETQVSRFSDEIITFTEQDSSRWIELSGSEAERVSIVPFGVSRIQKNYEARDARLVFLGNMYYEPNKRAVERIVHKVLPTVRGQHPGIRTLVVGDIPPDLRALCHKSSVECAGELPNVRPVLSECSIGLAPIMEGTGVRAKILQYLSCGLTVLATSIAAEGLNFPALFIEDNSQAYIRRCLELINGGHDTKPLVEATLDILRKEYQWTNIAQTAARVYEKTMRQAPQMKPRKTPQYYSAPLWIEEVLRKNRFSEPLSVVSDSQYRFGVAFRGKIETYN